MLKGLPAVNYSARDIIYRPRNVRAHRVYGYSPVQQVLMTVNIALRRQLWQLDYYSEGSIPDALIGVPAGWTPDQIKQFQDYPLPNPPPLAGGGEGWGFAGDLARRRRAKFVPGDTAVKIQQTKEPEQKNDFDEWLARIICYAFSVPPQWAVKLMNRATADNQSAQAEDEGLEPTKEWVKDLIDKIISEEFASPDLELAWLDEDEADPKGLEAVLEGRVKLGAVTLNEMRDALGLDPYANPAADRPMVLTATGYVPIEAGVGSATSGANSQITPPSIQKVIFDQPRLPCTLTRSLECLDQHEKREPFTKASPDDPEHPGWPALTPGGLGGKFSPKGGEQEVASSPEIIPVVDFSGGRHEELVNAWMDLFKKEGYPAVKELPIRLVNSTNVFGRLDILAKLPICAGICYLEMKTGNDPVFTENQRLYVLLLLLGGHVYSTDTRIKELGLVPGVPFPPMPVFVVWSKPGEPGYRIIELHPKKPSAN